MFFIVLLCNSASMFTYCSDIFDNVWFEFDLFMMMKGRLTIVFYMYAYVFSCDYMSFRNNFNVIYYSFT